MEFRRRKNMNIGDKIEFALPNQNGEMISSENYLNQGIIIYVYPKDNTPGCTKEACSYRDNYQLLEAKGYKVFGLSKDSVKSHKNFEEKYSLPFTLLSDENLTLIKELGSYQEKSLYGKKFMGVGRSTFIFDNNHQLVYQNFKVKAAEDAVSTLKILEKLEK